MLKNSYNYELLKKYIRDILINVLFLLSITIFSIIGPLLLRNVMNTQNSGFNKQNIIMYFIILLFLYVMKFFYNRFKFYFTEKFKNAETINLYKKVFRMQYEKINSLEPTYLVERIGTTIDTIFSLYCSSITGIFVSALVMIITLCIIFTINKPLTLIFFIQIPLQYFGFQKLLNGENSKLVKYGSQLQNVRAQSNKSLKLLLSDVNGIKQYGENGIILSLIHSSIKDATKLEKEANGYAMDICTILEFLSVGLKNISYLFIIYMYISGSLSVGDLVYLNLVNDIYYSSIGDVINIQINLRNLKGALQFVNDDIEKNYESNGSLELRNIETIDGQLDNIGYEDKVLIKSGNFHIKKGDVVGIVGESGCGKTTFVKLLNKFNIGRYIYINNIDIIDLDNDSLRQKVMYLPQASYLLPCSIKENILISNSDDSQLWEKLLKQNFMQGLKASGLNKIVTENAANLSGGEKQKIILARIFMQNPDVIILDESFNAIDEATGEDLFDIIKSEYHDRIIIVISHSPKYINGCNKKIRIQDQELIQEK